jgi:hypothetical protein
MFAAACHLMFACGLRVVWFPDINHAEHNAEKTVMSASGLSQVNEKVSFLARLPHGPQRDAGHWQAQMREAFEADSRLQNRVCVCVCSVFPAVFVQSVV